MLAPLSLLALLSSTLADAIPDTTGLEATYALQQRIFAESVSSPTAWTQRSLLLLKETPECVPNGLTPLPLDRSAMYQLAIKREGMDESSWPMLSIPACRFIGSDLTDTVTLHLNDENELLHFGYTTNAPSNACQSTANATTVTLHTQHTKVILSRPSRLNPPRLHEPVKIDYAADGTVKTPEKPKSFLQQYWYYIVEPPAQLMFAPGGDAPAAGGGAGS